MPIRNKMKVKNHFIIRKIKTYMEEVYNIK